jgi:hypothetical protein
MAFLLSGCVEAIGSSPEKQQDYSNFMQNGRKVIREICAVQCDDVLWQQVNSVQTACKMSALVTL